MKSYVINLQRAPQRLARFTSSADIYGWEIKRFDAIDRRDLRFGKCKDDGVSIVTHVGDPSLAINVVRGGLHEGHVACALSHLLLWIKLLDSDEEAFGIFEDDAVIERDNDFRDIPLDTDFLFISDRVSVLVPDEIITEEQLSEWVKISKLAPMVPGCGTEAYIVTRRGARKGIELMSEMFWPIDLQLMAYGHGTRLVGHSLSKRRVKTMPECRIYATTTPYTIHADQGISYIDVKRENKQASGGRDVNSTEAAHCGPVNCYSVSKQVALDSALEEVRRFSSAHLDGEILVCANSQARLAALYRSNHSEGEYLPLLKDTGFKKFSQTDEDGLLLYIYSLIGTTNKIALEICAGNGIECNSANLIINHGWSAILFDGNPNLIEEGRMFYSKYRANHIIPPKFVNERITKRNINQLIENSAVTGEIDLMSLDMDGVDYWILNEIIVVQPRVVVVEYQDILGSKKALTVPYSDDFNGWAGPTTNGLPNFCGASLRAFQKLLEKRGYRLVGCNELGYNAFFIRADLVSEAIPECKIESCFIHPKVVWGIRERFPSIAEHPWVEV